jgi:hypothetical protein
MRDLHFHIIDDHPGPPDKETNGDGMHHPGVYYGALRHGIGLDKPVIIEHPFHHDGFVIHPIGCRGDGPDMYGLFPQLPEISHSFPLSTTISIHLRRVK